MDTLLGQQRDTRQRRDALTDIVRHTRQNVNPRPPDLQEIYNLATQNLDSGNLQELVNKLTRFLHAAAAEARARVAEITDGVANLTT